MQLTCGCTSQKWTRHTTRRCCEVQFVCQSLLEVEVPAQGREESFKVARILQQHAETLPEKYRKEFEELKEKEAGLAFF